LKDMVSEHIQRRRIMLFRHFDQQVAGEQVETHSHEKRSRAQRPARDLEGEGQG